MQLMEWREMFGLHVITNAIAVTFVLFDGVQWHQSDIIGSIAIDTECFVYLQKCTSEHDRNVFIGLTWKREKRLVR